MNPLRTAAVDGGATIEISLQARASRPGMGKVREGVLGLKVSAPPVEGRANEAARRLLAELLGISPSRVALKSGARGRRKVFFIGGLTPSEMVKRLERNSKSP